MNMKIRSLSLLAVSTVTLFSQSALAHSGHDHSLASSAVHSLTFFGLIILGAAATYSVNKHLARKKISSQDAK
jgi:TRAP-type C4-dicarboxylate transport system permease small subunit